MPGERIWTMFGLNIWEFFKTKSSAYLVLCQGSFGQGSFGPRFLLPRFLWTKVPLDRGSFSQGSFGSRFLCQGSFGPGSFGQGSSRITPHIYPAFWVHFKFWIFLRGHLILQFKSSINLFLEFLDPKFVNIRLKRYLTSFLWLWLKCFFREWG